MSFLLRLSLVAGLGALAYSALSREWHGTSGGGAPSDAPENDFEARLHAVDPPQPALPGSEDFQAALQDLLAEARRRGADHLDVNAGALHRKVGGYPGPGHRIETVSGDLMLATSGGLALEVRGLSTDVSVALPHRSEGSRDRRRYVVGGGEANLLFSSMSGDVVVHGPRRGGGGLPPLPPLPPLEVTPPAPPPPPRSPRRQLSDAEQLEVLQALERGEIDVEEAAELITESWRLRAPRSLVRDWDATR